MTDSMQQESEFHAAVRDAVAVDYGPVEDWATDFDILDDDYIVHPEKRWAERRRRWRVPATRSRQRRRVHQRLG